jgi:hypothetical protein
VQEVSDILGAEEAKERRGRNECEKEEEELG